MSGPALESYSGTWAATTRWSLASAAKAATLLPLPADGHVDGTALLQMLLDSSDRDKDVEKEQERVEKTDDKEDEKRRIRAFAKTEWLRRVARHLDVGKVRGQIITRERS
jgi:hypothetical protein